jgi:hypothetical protein
MLSDNSEQITVRVKQTSKFLLYRVLGQTHHPLRFDLINLDGKKVRSVDLLYGNEFVIPIRGLEKGEYLYALNGIRGLIQTGVIAI